MKEYNCEFEPAALKSVEAENGSAELSLHISGCPICRETVKVARWMKTFSARSQPKSVPTAGFIRWKAQIFEKQIRAAAATKPIAWAQTAAIVLTLAAVFWLLFNNQTPFESVFRLFSASFELIAIPVLLGAVCAALTCFLFVYKWRDQARKK